MGNMGFRAKELIHGADYNPDQWLDTHGIIDEDVRLMELAGLNSVTVGVFSWKNLEPEEGVYTFEWLDEIMDRMAQAGKKVILAAPSGARPAWMDRDHNEVLRVSAERVRNLHGERHNHCYTSPYYRKKTVEMNTLLAKRYGRHPALYMWHVGNEYGGECHCELCQEAFREWLKKKYHGDIGELNRQWWTGFWSHGFSDFSEIESPSVRGEHSLHGLNLDWKRFVTDQTVDFFKNESAPFRELTPEIPVTTNLMGMYKGFNPWKMAPFMDLISWDTYPEWGREKGNEADIALETAFSHDLFRSLKKQPYFVMENTPSVVNWREVNKLKKPGVHELSAVLALAHGADSIQYFQWRKSRGASEKLHGAVVDHYGKEDTRVFREVSQCGKLLEKLAPLAGSDVKAEAALLYDWENFWAIEHLQGWRQPRLYDETALQHYRALRKLGLPVDIVDEECDFRGYRIVAAPMLYLLRAGVAERLKQFVADGGTLVLTYGSGEVNENDLCFLGGFPGGGLMDAAGVWAEEMDTLYENEYNSTCARGTDRCYQVDSYCELIHPQADTEVLLEYADDFYAGMAAATRHAYGKGCCYYLAARFEQAYLNELYRDILKEKGMTGGVMEVQKGIDVSVRSNGTEEYLFLLNFSGKEACVKLADGRSYRDFFTEEPVEGIDSGVGMESSQDTITGTSGQGVVSLPENGYRILVINSDK